METKYIYIDILATWTYPAWYIHQHSEYGIMCHLKAFNIADSKICPKARCIESVAECSEQAEFNLLLAEAEFPNQLVTPAVKVSYFSVQVQTVCEVLRYEVAQVFQAFHVLQNRTRQVYVWAWE